MSYDDKYDIEMYNEESVLMNEHKQKFGKHRYYPSNKQQTFIKNAVTGIKYPYMVGSFDQQRLYKMIDATGTCNSDGYVIKSKYDLPNPDANHLFYDSPEQCMKHLRIAIQQKEIDNWRERSKMFTAEKE